MLFSWILTLCVVSGIVTLSHFCDRHSKVIFFIIYHFLFCRYLPGPDDMLVLDIAYVIYLKFEEYPNALQIALFLDNLQV